MSRGRRSKKQRPIAQEQRKPHVAPAPERRFEGVSLWLGLMLLATLAASLWLLLRPDASLAPRPWNVVLVSVDTLRPDRLGSYGGAVPTPNLDRLAREGVIFENATTVAPVTLPAHASLLTSLYPLSHGVRDNGRLALSDAHETLAEALRRGGYRTGAFVGAFVLDSRWGLDQGFERYSDDVGSESSERRGEEVLSEALAWMGSVRSERFFSWIHLFDPHVPYDPPTEYAQRGGVSTVDRYDGEVAYVDALIGNLIDWLEERELADETLIVFVADHGESLGEHGEDTHGFFVYESTMRIPLVMRLPSYDLEAHRILSRVRIIDVMPTVLGLVGGEPPEGVQGRSLVPMIAGTEEDLGLTAYGEATFPAHYGFSELASLRKGQWHYVDAPRPELYDLIDDPRENKDLSGQRAATVRELADELETIRAELRSDAEAAESAEAPLFDPRAESNLRALGYLGGVVPTRAAATDERADPKDKIKLFNKIRAASTALQAADYDRGLDLVREVLAADAEIVEAHRMMGELHARRRKFDEAATAFQKALTRDPEYLPAIFGLASAYRDMGRLSDAVSGYERMLELEPRSIVAAAALARIRIDNGRFDEALDVVRALDDRLGPNEDRASLSILRAEALIGKGDVADAETLLRDALTESESRFVPDAHLFLGVIAESRRDLSSALTEYEAELDAFPDSSRAHFNAGRVLGQLGREDEMIDHLEAAIAANPEFAVAHLYLANAYLERGRLQRALVLATRGLELGPDPSLAPFGHFILADVYQRLGRGEDAARELAIAQKLRGS